MNNLLIDTTSSSIVEEPSQDNQALVMCETTTISVDSEPNISNNFNLASMARKNGISGIFVRSESSISNTIPASMVKEQLTSSQENTGLLNADVTTSISVDSESSISNKTNLISMVEEQDIPNQDSQTSISILWAIAMPQLMMIWKATIILMASLVKLTSLDSKRWVHCV
ncbi:uncharacterized protein LOC109409882 [Aedes albopictus]|uniref:Uncharacterized protein n=1 Tax=Aedes albopictus TaxID=7160 RepID=A0ABM2A6J3_AEDAL